MLVTNARAEQARAIARVTVTAAPEVPEIPVVPGGPGVPGTPGTPGVAGGPTLGPAGLAPFRPPLAAGDGDGDGTPNGRDLCPATVPGTKARLDGCSLADAMVSPAPLAMAAAEDLRRQRRDLHAVPRLRRAIRRPLARIDRSAAGMVAAGRLLAADPCRASLRAGAALATGRGGTSGIGRAVADAQRAYVVGFALAQRRSPRAGIPTDGLDTRLLTLAAAGADARATLARLGRLRGLFRAACAADGGAPTSVTGRVTAIDSSTASATLANGTRLALGAARRVDGLGVGVAIRARGRRAGGALVASEAAAADVSATLAPDCAMTPRIAPVQDFASSADFLYYDPRGYLDGDRYVLEGGMAISAVRSGVCIGHDQFRLQMSLTYWDLAGVKHVNRPIGWVLGDPSDPDDLPALIPEDVSYDTSITLGSSLRFRLYGYDCAPDDDGIQELCSGGQLLSESSWKVRLRPKGEWGRAEYADNRFSVEDGSPTDHGTTTFTGLNAPQTILPAPTIFGVGYAIENGASTYPSRRWIVPGEQLAVHDPASAAPEDYEDNNVGVQGGLLWAYVHGLRNGFPYHYWAERQSIVTDVIDACPAPVPGRSYYRLPWGDSAELVAQGNYGSFSHKGDAAWDFVLGDGEIGRAPRGGLVATVEESKTKNTDPAQIAFLKQILDIPEELIDQLIQPANALQILHQDGSTSWYFHMRHQGVFPKLGQVVDRGTDVVKVGNTGYSTTPHLHYEVTESRYSPTSIRIRFEGKPTASAAPVSCVIPDKGETWWSTNEPK